MSIDIKYPNISATTEAGKLEQIRGYLFQLADQLMWALNHLEGGATVLQEGSKAGANEVTEEKAQSTFNSIKSLIIKSADIVNAYSDEINKRLYGQYVARSDYGTFVELTEQSVSVNSTAIKSLFESMQQIITDIEGIDGYLIEVNAHTRAGRLYYDDEGIPIYGFEIGQINSIDGEEVFNKYARFTSDRLSFYDQNDTEVAYISDYKLYIANVEVGLSMKIGGFKDIVQSNGDVVEKWIGRG
jgi:hypothetical protein